MNTIRLFEIIMFNIPVEALPGLPFGGINKELNRVFVRLYRPHYLAEYEGRPRIFALDIDQRFFIALRIGAEFVGGDVVLKLLPRTTEGVPAPLRFGDIVEFVGRHTGWHSKYRVILLFDGVELRAIDVYQENIYGPSPPYPISGKFLDVSELPSKNYYRNILSFYRYINIDLYDITDQFGGCSCKKLIHRTTGASIHVNFIREVRSDYETRIDIIG